MAEIAPIRDLRPRATPKSLEVGRRATLRSWPHFLYPRSDVSSSRTQPGATAAWFWRRAPRRETLRGALATATVRRPLRACAQGDAAWRPNSKADRRMETADGHALLAGRCNRISRSLGCGSVFVVVSWLRRAELFWREHLILDDVVADVSSQLDDQAELGIQVTRQNEVPEVGRPTGVFGFRYLKSRLSLLI